MALRRVPQRPVITKVSTSANLAAEAERQQNPHLQRPHPLSRMPREGAAARALMEIASLRHQDAHNLRFPESPRTGFGRFSFVYCPEGLAEMRPVLLLLNGILSAPLHRIAGFPLPSREQNDSLLS